MSKEKKIEYALIQVPFTAFLLQIALILLFDYWNYIIGFLIVSTITVFYIYVLDKKTKKINNNKHNNNGDSEHTKD